MTEVTHIMTNPARWTLSVGRRSAKSFGVHTSRARLFLPCRKRCGEWNVDGTTLAPRRREGAGVKRGCFFCWAVKPPLVLLVPSLALCFS